MSDYRGKLWIEKWSREGFRGVRFEPGVMDLVDAEAERVAAQCGDGFVVRTWMGKNRYRANIWPKSRKARRAALGDMIMHKVAAANGMTLGGGT